MAVTRERFEQGMTYDAYKAQMTRNRDRFEDNERTVTLPADDVAFFQSLPHPLNVLILAEDWCGDVINNVPVLGRLNEATGQLNMRIFLRDQNLDIMDQYLNKGQFRSIPAIVLFDNDFRELGLWIERPALINELRAKIVDDLFANDPAFAGLPPMTSPGELPEAARGRYMQAMAEFRSQVRDTANAEVVREIRGLVAQSLAGAAR